MVAGPYRRLPRQNGKKDLRPSAKNGVGVSRKGLTMVGVYEHVSAKNGKGEQGRKRICRCGLRRLKRKNEPCVKRRCIAACFAKSVPNAGRMMAYMQPWAAGPFGKIHAQCGAHDDVYAAVGRRLVLQRPCVIRILRRSRCAKALAGCGVSKFCRRLLMVIKVRLPAAASPAVDLQRAGQQRGGAGGKSVVISFEALIGQIHLP